MIIRIKKKKVSNSLVLLFTAIFPIHNLCAQAYDYTGKDTKGIEDIVNDAVEQKDWRADAYERIDEYRKADLAITVKDASGRVLPNAEITIEQTDHEFPFGMVVNAREIAGVGETSDLFREILPYFANKLCIENSLKQRNGPANEERTRGIFKWAKEHGFEIRGHNLIWPHGMYLPKDVETFVYGKTHTSYNEQV